MKFPKHTNTRIYIASLLIALALTVIVIAIQLITLAFKEDALYAEVPVSRLYVAIGILFAAAFFVLIFMHIPLLTYAVLYFVQLYRMWDVINDGQSRATPGKAIGYLFIPVFNIYWVFNIWGGFPADYNAFVDRNRLNNKVPTISPTIYQLFPALILLSGFIVTIPILLIYFAFLLDSSNKAIDGIKMAAAESGTRVSGLGFQRELSPNLSQ